MNSRLLNVFDVLLQLFNFNLSEISLSSIDTQCDAKSGNSLSSKKRKKKREKNTRTCILEAGSSIITTPSLEVWVWYPVCTCYGISVTVRLCLKLKPNVCSALREVNCMLAIWSRVKDLRQACDMKCKSVLKKKKKLFCFFYVYFFFFFFLMLRFFLFIFFKDQLVILVL